jgi:predicted GH43/DUF377 family glycosyl hydrolase
VTAGRLATRVAGRIAPDPSRVLAQLFVPGHAVAGSREGRASGVVDHILALDDAEVDEVLAAIRRRFDGRHRELAETFRLHADRIRNRLSADVELSAQRWMLLGATFTQEYAVEGAAVCNPSAVPLPDQTGLPSGSVRFAMSVRQVGEGHRSSIGFRVGLVDHRGEVSIEAASRFVTGATIEAHTLAAPAFRSLARRFHHDAEAITWVLDRLGEQFSSAELDERLAELEDQRDTRRNVGETVRRLRELATRSYTAQFSASSPLSERVLLPANAVESHGIEDARFVRFVDDDGGITYYATATAFDGTDIAQQLLATTDFVTFRASPLVGAAAANKGMALFPRRIDGAFVALSRHDGAGNAVAFSDDVRHWSAAAPLPSPPSTWEAVQVGNCGSPIETDDGWLVLTHGVGPMRSYSIGASLLELHDPTKVIGRLDGPLLVPEADEQDGYVPNVVYSCGSLLHGATLVIPYGIGDAAIGFATVPLADLLGAMQRPPPGQHH